MEFFMIKSSSPIAYDEFITYLDKLFNISLNDIKVIIAEFHAEMQKGLSGYESSLKMIPSFTDRPKGHEKGKFIALDLGGTNFRVLAVELDGKGNSAILAVSKFAIKKKDMQGTAEQLFDFIASCIEEFIIENKLDTNKIYDLAFTFSFPVEQTNIAAGKLIVWTKGFTAKGVQGMDVIILLNEALKRKDIKCIRVAALANDTVGTLVAKSYTDHSCDLGVIMGTGTNACYPEKLSNIQKWRGLDPKGHMIINMEWGNFNKLRQTYYDKRLDAESVNPGAMFLEKMLSGMYLGSITSLIVWDLIKRNLIFNNVALPLKEYIKKDLLQTEHMSLIASDDSTNLGEVEDFLSEKGVNNVTLHDRQVLKRLCNLVSTRAAKIGAAAIAGVLTWMDPELKNKHTVGIDGSLFEKYPDFDKKMLSVFDKLYGNKAANIELVHAKDGSGKGAAIIAAVAAQSEK
jgi:hexokinase